MWIALRASERAILEGVNLQHLVTNQLPETVRALAEDPDAWVNHTHP